MFKKWYFYGYLAFQIFSGIFGLKPTYFVEYMGIILGASIHSLFIFTSVWLIVKGIKWIKNKIKPDNTHGDG